MLPWLVVGLMMMMVVMMTAQYQYVYKYMDIALVCVGLVSSVSFWLGFGSILN